MSSLTKFAIQDNSLIINCKDFLNKMKSDINPEMQQRANEYFTFLEFYSKNKNHDEIEMIFDAMPTYNIDIAKKNVLLKVLDRKENKETKQEKDDTIKIKKKNEVKQTTQDRKSVV